MAIDRVGKFLVAVHRGERDAFLRKLQRAGFFHIAPAEGATATAEEDRALARVVSAVEVLAAGADRKAKARPVLSREEFDRAALSYEPGPVLDRLEGIGRDLAELDARQKLLEAEQSRLGPWRELQHDPEELNRLAGATVILGRFADSEELNRAQEAAAGLAAGVEEVGRAGTEVLALIAVAPEALAEVNRILAGLRFEAADLRGVRGRPRDVLDRLAEQAAQVEKRRQELKAEMAGLTAELGRLKVAADALAGARQREHARAQAEQTESVAVLRGWIRERDKGRLERLVRSTPSAAAERLEPEPGEEPPIALVNRPVFRPFELVVELFSMPSAKEMDPTWLVAPFFGVFFGLCLTDAGYGIAVAVGTWLLMRKLGMRNKLLGIVLIGALLTIPAGAMVGGWFGDLPDRLGIAWLTGWKNRLMWFDPMKDPMKFFILSVALGYVQLMAGIVFEIADCLRNREWGQGLLGQMPWFLLLNGLVARVAAGRLLPERANTALVVVALAAVAAIVVFTQREKKTALAQGLWFGALVGLFVFLGARFRLVPAGLAAAKWVGLGFFVALQAQAAISLLRHGKPKNAGLVAAAVALGAFAAYAAGAVSWLVPGLAGTVFFALSPAGGSLFGKLFWGGYALYGATSYVGVVLSYIRLMALGMCTGGVAMAINVIAWMLLKIPVAGVVLALVMLAGGHAYNIAVNVLGAFVHSLRLQYVEFFPRFYTGGGERFQPLAEEHQFVSVK